MGSDDLKLLIHTAKMPEKAEQAKAVQRVRIHKRLTFQERLLRNSFVACAVLLGILALNNIRQPWAERASKHVEDALTMTIDLDQSLGQLSFVRNLMPESALVFFDLAKDSEMLSPVIGTPIHAFDPVEPYLLFHAENGDAVRAAGDGTVSAVCRLSDGTCGVLIDHGAGLESVTAGLCEVIPQNGDTVSRGDPIGAAGGDIYFELRQQNSAVDPSGRLGF